MVVAVIKIPLETVFAKIKEQIGLSDGDIEEKIKAKMSQLSGLVSREGAAHIVANELGVKVIGKTSGRLKIKEILSGMRDIEIVGKITDIFEVRQFAKQDGTGQVGSFIVGDESGSIRIVCWGGQADLLKNMKADDVVKVQNGYVRDNNGRFEVHINDRSRIVVNPAGESVGEVVRSPSGFSGGPARRKAIADLKDEEENVEILGTIVQVFDPRYFEVCPSCGKRARPQEDGSVTCDGHGPIKPAYSYVTNVMLDDGSQSPIGEGVVRVVLFKNQAERLLKKTPEAMLAYKDEPMLFDAVKTELLGNQLKVIGRVKKNPMFDRVEFVAQLVDAEPSPEAELERLEKGI